MQATPALRTFIGIPIPPAIGSNLVTLKRRAKAPESWNWTREDDLHITLKFLGSLTPAQLHYLGSHLSAIRASPVEISLTRPNFFDRVGVLLVDVAPTEPLLALQSAVEQASTMIGVAPEARPFHPHITIARSPRRRPIPPHRDLIESLDALCRKLPTRDFTAPEFVLFQSNAGRYTALGGFPLEPKDLTSPT